MHVANEKILGRIRKPSLDEAARASYLKHYCKVQGIDNSDATAIGDGANDIGMLLAAGTGVAFMGKKLLHSAIAIQLNHTELIDLFYLQGFHHANIKTS
jgi:phosphoserine phosphatase